MINHPTARWGVNNLGGLLHARPESVFSAKLFGTTEIEQGRDNQGLYD